MACLHLHWLARTSADAEMDFLLRCYPGSPSLRAAIEPHGERLVCVDLADHLAAWPAGDAAILRRCGGMDAAHAALRESPGRMTSVIYWHVAPENADFAALDCLGQEAAAAGGMPSVLTTAEGVDGVRGTVDLLQPLA